MGKFIDIPDWLKLDNILEEEYDLKSVQEYLKAKSEGTLNLILFEEAIKEWDIE